MKTPDLKPCPNCGNTKLGIYRSLLKGRKYEVFCGKCDWYGRQAFTRWGAMKKWNRDCERLSGEEVFGVDQAGIPAYTCPDCGLVYWPVTPCPNCGSNN